MSQRESIDGVILFPARRIEDARGYFTEIWRADAPSLPAFVQANESLSHRAGTLRGLHFQGPPFAQAKLVRCVRGRILDVVVDLRAHSPTFGDHATLELSDIGMQLFVPAGFAHGFLTLEPDTLVNYFVSAPYAPGHEFGLAWDDPTLGIRWPVDEPILSDRDRRHPRLAELPRPF